MISDSETNESSSSHSYGDFMDFSLLIDLSKAVLSRTLMIRKRKSCVTCTALGVCNLLWSCSTK